MLQRIHTWVPDPVLGDMNYEHEFTNASYVDAGGGVKFPTGWHSHEGWDDNFNSQSITAGHNAFGGTMKDIKPNVCPDPVTVPDAVRQATFPLRVETQKLADAVWLLGGSSHNSVAVEFKDYVAVVEAPLNEKRSLAVIEEVVKLVPNKPIRFVVNTHQHADGMLMAYLPKEKLVIEADIVDTDRPLPATPTRDMTSFYKAAQALKLDASQIVPIHGKPIPWNDFAKVAGSNKSN